VLAAVAVLAFVLLMIAFRSVAISLVSILLNLLSVGAAYGLITLIFQDGRLQGTLGYTSFGGIISWVPLFMLVFLPTTAAREAATRRDRRLHSRE
jgi:putative drug exporter of the RND superfamily